MFEHRGPYAVRIVEVRDHSSNDRTAHTLRTEPRLRVDDLDVLAVHRRRSLRKWIHPVPGLQSACALLVIVFVRGYAVRRVLLRRSEEGHVTNDEGIQSGVGSQVDGLFATMLAHGPPSLPADGAAPVRTGVRRR